MSQPKRYKTTVTKLALGLILGLIPAMGLVAQDDFPSDEDIFSVDAFESAVETGITNAESNVLTWLGGVTLVSNQTYTQQLASEEYGLLATLNGKAFLKATKPDVGSFFVSYNVAHTLLAATNDPARATAYEAMDPDFAEPSLALGEIHLSFDLGKRLFLRVGNQLLSWGASSVWSPADFVNQRPLDSQAALDTRAGKPGLRLHVPFSGGNVFAFVDFSETLGSLEAGNGGDLRETAVTTARADGSIGGFNLGVQGSFGPGTIPRLGFTATGRALIMDVWGELALDFPQDEDLVWKTSVGGQYDFGPDRVLFVRGEYFHQSNGAEGRDLLPMDSFLPLYLGKDYLSVGLGTTKLGIDELALSGSFLANLSDESWTGRGTLDLRFPKVLPLSISMVVNGGPENREFTLRNGGSTWELQLRSILEF